MSNTFKWHEVPNPDFSTIRENDIREVTLPVTVVFEWSDNIVDEVDEITMLPISYTSGWVMTVLPGQQFVYNNESTLYIGSTFKVRDPDGPKPYPSIPKKRAWKQLRRYE